MPLDFSSAVDDFHNARRRAGLEEIMARFTGKSADLLSYEDVRQMLKAETAEPRGLQEIPLDAIVGSVGRYTDFTRSFLPLRDSDRERWARIELATARSANLPPIEVYQIGQAYFVSDGNHRVSAARRLGMTHIWAYVTQVLSRVPLSPDDRPDDIILKAEYAEFLEYTRLDESRPQADLSVTVPGKYPEIEGQIEVYRYFLHRSQRRDISYEETAAIWYDEVYLPVVNVIRERGILWEFPGRTETDLYLWILEHRGALQEQLGWPIRPEAAAADLAEQFSSRPQRVASRLGSRILNAVRPAGFEDGPSPGRWRREQLATRQADRLFADIVVPVSGEEIGWQALDQALRVAQREGGRLLGLHVVSSDAQKESPTVQAIRDEFVRRCQAAGLPGELVIEVGAIARTICDRARWSDLVVVHLAYPPGPQPAARFRSGFRLLIQRCPRPVLAVPRAVSHLGRALLAYDGSPKAEEALFVATYLAARWGIRLEVVTVSEAGHQASSTLAHSREYLEAHGVQATFLQESGAVAETILAAARAHESDLMIMGGYGSGPVLEVVLGSSVDQVLRESQYPVLICR